MNVLPEIVKTRLNAGRVGDAGDHPDFGLLTAFIEHSLPKNRRSEILLHLAHCGRCNELVSLAAPAPTEEVQRRIKSSWTLWKFVPVPRFVVPAIGTAIVLVAVWLARVPVAEGPVARVAPAPPTTKALPHVLPPTSSAAVQKDATNRPISSSVVAKALPQSTDKENSELPEAISRDAANVTMHTTVAPPRPTNALPTGSPGSTPMTSAVAAPPAGPCWRVSDSDALQKASTCGRGWEDISLGPPVKVRVVLAQANSVWVGGTGGQLYHSEDNGEHWKKVSVPMLSDDIVAIVFGTPTHGRLATSSGVIWATSDGGQTWRRE